MDPKSTPKPDPNRGRQASPKGVQKKIDFGVVFDTIFIDFLKILVSIFKVLGFALSIDLAKCKVKQCRKTQGSASNMTS